MCTGQWQGGVLHRFSKPRTVEAGLALQTAADAHRAAETMLRVCFDGVSFLRNLWRRFTSDVLESHGIHIPRSVRDAATVLFWLSDIVFDERLLEGSRTPAEAADRCSSLPEVLAYAERQLTMFEWPDSNSMKCQYQLLCTSWAKLLARDTTLQKEFHPNRPFPWNRWWQLAHVDPRFHVPGAVAAFHIFNCLAVWALVQRRRSRWPVC